MSHLANNYKRKKISFKKGNGSYLYTESGVRYLDFVGSNNNLTKDKIIKDYISANLFYEHSRNLNDNNNYDPKINEIFNDVNIDFRRVGGKKFNKLKSGIDFKNISFSYGSKSKVLKNFNYKGQLENLESLSEYYFQSKMNIQNCLRFRYRGQDFNNCRLIYFTKSIRNKSCWISFLKENFLIY